mmetsp:Transcript_2118/g.3924  ORF Transcript_2118/g.3924 Transcript_2118/m.3924 type:complete len:110 (-) Transcript_2118:53-382(-)
MARTFAQAADGYARQLVVQEDHIRNQWVSGCSCHWLFGLTGSMGDEGLCALASMAPSGAAPAESSKIFGLDVNSSAEAGGVARPLPFCGARRRGAQQREIADHATCSAP